MPRHTHPATRTEAKHRARIDRDARRVEARRLARVERAGTTRTPRLTLGRAVAP